ncbi:MAG: TonB-dependent receptor [Brevinematales bacterium]|nr:TonB-dependent receptor [Brevinematales bacterium]
MNFNKILFLMLFPSFFFSIELKGKIFNKDSRSKIADAIVILKNSKGEVKTTQTDQKGEFIIEDLEEDSYEIEIKLIGFYPERKTFILKKDENLTIYLSQLPTASFGEIEVKGEREKISVSKNTVDKKTLEKATTSVTGDPIEVMKKMPGVDSTSRGNFSTASRLSIRGGQGFETIGLFDGMKIDYFYHRIIQDSVFIDDLIEEVTLYKGVAPVEYGQLMSGLLDVKTIKPPTGFHGKLNLGLLNTYLTLYGTTEDEKWEYLWGIRRTHYDLIFNLFLQEEDADMVFAIPYYIDSQGKITYNGDNDKISLICLYSFEPAMISNIANTNKKGETNQFYGGINYQYIVGGLEWRHIFSPDFFVEQQISGAINYQKGYIGISSNEFFNEIVDNNIRYKVMAGYYPVEIVGLKIGFETTYYPDLIYSYKAKGFYTNIVTQKAEFTNFIDEYTRTNFLVLSGFLGSEIELFEKKFFISPGIRINYFNYIDKFSYDPRATLEYRFTDEHKAYISAGYLSQFTTEPFVLGLLTKEKDKIDIPGVWQYIVGEKSKFFDYWEVSLEGYLKHYVNVLSRVSNIQLEFKTTDNRLDIYGAEIMLKKNPGGIPFYGWLSGSVMNIWAYVKEGEDPNNFYGFNFNIDENGNVYGGINSKWKYASSPINEWFNFWKYKFNLTLIWEFLKNWSLTGEFIYESRGYFTPVESVSSFTVGTNTVYVPKYGKYNSERLPDFHQLNIKLEWTPTFFNLPWGFYIQIMNIYNNKEKRYYYTEDYSEKKISESPLGIWGFGGFWVKW